MTRDQIIDIIAKDANMTKKAAKNALDAIIEAISTALAKEEKVTFTGFGTFSVSQRAARKGKNPKTLAVIDIPAKKVPVFKAGKTLRENVK